MEEEKEDSNEKKEGEGGEGKGEWLFFQLKQSKGQLIGREVG